MTRKPPVYRDGKLYVMAERCSTCIFRPGNLMSLQPGRQRDMLEAAKANDAAVICHQTLDGREGAICRGSLDAFEPTAYQLARALNVIELVTPT